MRETKPEARGELGKRRDAERLPWTCARGIARDREGGEEASEKSRGGGKRESEDTSGSKRNRHGLERTRKREEETRKEAQQAQKRNRRLTTMES